MQTRIPLMMVSLLLIAGCAGVRGDRGPPYTPVTPKESFSIGAFTPSATEYNFKHYDRNKAGVFLASVSDRFSDGDIVAVDGLKWQKSDGEWAPIPNPPIPVFQAGDNVNAHLRRYAKWIEDHPHFEYPPLPNPKKE